MLLADSNIWLALALSKHDFHNAARDWLAEQTAPASVLFCRSTQQSFLRLLTTQAILARYGLPALRNKAAWRTYERIRADKRIGWIEEPSGLEALWKRLAGGAQPSPKVWMDAYLAAFAITGEYQMVTTDAAFKQFKALDLILLAKA
jgi:toxin-antitoxin system PIN domain toxin